MAKPSDIFVSDSRHPPRVLIRFTPVTAPRHNPKYSVIQFLPSKPTTPLEYVIRTRIKPN